MSLSHGIPKSPQPRALSICDTEETKFLSWFMTLNAAVSNPPALAVRGLKKTYDNGVVALKGVDLEVAAGDFFALLGPNGAGKSTLIGIVSSLVNLSEGDVEVFGHSLRKNRSAVKQQIGLVPQEYNFNQFEKPIDICINSAGYFGVPRALAEERAEKYLRELSLWEKKDVASRSLSGGMKRRLLLARAMVHEPKLLILDEPTAGVDIEIRRSLWKFVQSINAAGTSVILTTHYLEEAESMCRNIAIINRGEIIENTSMAQLLATLDTEAFVLDLVHPLTQAPDLGGVRAHLLSPQSLEVELPRGGELNALFGKLSASGIAVASLRNKSNRLEELFLRRVEQPSQTVRSAVDQPGARS
jgi:ABC-2 type transport system ATP-binding protein